MCHFLSAVVLRNGDIICDPEHTDSHEDLIQFAGLDKSDGWVRRFVRVEFVPNDFANAANLESYVFRVDEEATPEWFEEYRERVTDNLRERVRRMIVTGERDLLLGGCWILADGAKVAEVKNARIVAMCDTSSVVRLYGSCSVGAMYDTSSVGVMYDTSSVGVMYDTSSVGKMFGGAKIGVMYGTSSVSGMFGSSSVGRMCGSSSVGKMLDTSSVGDMYGTSLVGDMFNGSSVGAMYDGSSVGMVFDAAKAPRKPVR